MVGVNALEILAKQKIVPNRLVQSTGILVSGLSGSRVQKHVALGELDGNVIVTHRLHSLEAPIAQDRLLRVEVASTRCAQLMGNLAAGVCGLLVLPAVVVEIS